MANPHCPRADAKALQCLRLFADTIAQNPGVYACSQADAQALLRVTDDFERAYRISVNPDTRTSPAILEKDQARNSAEQLRAVFYMLIKHNRGISDQDKIAIGVRPLNTGRERIPCPRTSPALAVIAATPGAHVLRHHDSLNPTTPAKPFGAVHLQLYIAYGDTVITDPRQATFYKGFTRNPMSVEFDHGRDGQRATYFGRWTSRNGDTGPWSTPVSMRVSA